MKTGTTLTYVRKEEKMEETTGKDGKYKGRKTEEVKLVDN